MGWCLLQKPNVIILYKKQIIFNITDVIIYKGFDYLCEGMGIVNNEE